MTPDPRSSHITSRTRSTACGRSRPCGGSSNATDSSTLSRTSDRRPLSSVSKPSSPTRHGSWTRHHGSSPTPRRSRFSTSWMTKSRVALASQALVTVKAADPVNVLYSASYTFGLPASLLRTTLLSSPAGLVAARSCWNSSSNSLGIVFKHSTPYHPQTCGKFECFHQTVKRFLRKQAPARFIAVSGGLLGLIVEAAVIESSGEGFAERLTPKDRDCAVPAVVPREVVDGWGLSIRPLMA